MLAPKSSRYKTGFFQTLIAVLLIVCVLHMIIDSVFVSLAIEEKIQQRDEYLKQDMQEYYDNNFYFDKTIARYPGPAYSRSAQSPYNDLPVRITRQFEPVYTYAYEEEGYDGDVWIEKDVWVATTLPYSENSTRSND